MLTALSLLDRGPAAFDGIDLDCKVRVLCVLWKRHLLQSLDVTKSRWIAQSIASSVTRLFNQSLESDLFPVLWKVSNVVPIPKAGDIANPDYRLIPLLSTLLEK